MNKIHALILMILLPACFAVAGSGDKSRLIVMTDLGGFDPDDKQSLIHLLLCSDRIDIEGVISTNAWLDDPDRRDSIRAVADNYREVYNNLSRHSSGVITPDRLDSIIMRGQEKAHIYGTGEGMDSEGSEWIISRVSDESDGRPVWIAAWGGMNTLAQALQKASRIYDKDEFERFKGKIRIYDVLGQDDAGAWIAANYPDIMYIRNKEVYGWAPDDKWTDDNIQSVSQFGKHYPDRIWATEGDSPSFLYVYSNGLNAPEHPDWGGWGGRFSLTKGKNPTGMDFIERSGKDESAYGDYYMLVSAPEGVNAINMWREHIYNDFAARMKWTETSDYSKANHHPVVTVNRHHGNMPLHIRAKAGEKVTLDASGCSDPDNDGLKFCWTIYDKPVSYEGNVAIADSTDKTCVVNIPAGEGYGTLHVVLAVTDTGVPSLTSYKRIVIDVEEGECQK